MEEPAAEEPAAAAEAESTPAPTNFWISLLVVVGVLLLLATLHATMLIHPLMNVVHE